MDLFDSTYIGNLKVKNHFIRSATFEGKANKDGSPTNEILSIYRDLAKGGVGTIITSYAYITDYEQPEKYQLGIHKDELIGAYKNLVDMIHSYDTKIIMQIAHGSSHSQAYPETAKILGPSAIPHPISNIRPKEMTRQEIQNVIKSFADASQRVKAAGFDGVQIHSAHWYLLSQFISPLFNKRTDSYGESTENRLRIVMEVYQAVREKVGPDFPIWVKINSTDQEPDGLTVEDFLQMSKHLSKAGIDAIEVSGQWRKFDLDERLYYKDAAIKLSKMVDTPIILTGGVRTIEDMTKVYNSSKVKLFGLSRPLLKDPAYIKSLS